MGYRGTAKTSIMGCSLWAVHSTKDQSSLEADAKGGSWSQPQGSDKSKYCRYQEGEAVTMPLLLFVWGFSSSVLKLLSLFY